MIYFFYMKTNSQLKQEIIKLWSQGKSISQIQGQLNIIIEINCSLAEIHKAISQGDFKINKNFP